MADIDNRNGTRLRETATWLNPSMCGNRQRRSCWALRACVVLSLIAVQVDAETINPATVYVLDRDTIRLDGDSWRLVGFDTPETYEPDCDFELALGQAATARLRGLMASGRVVEVIRLPGRDRFDRGLARLYVGGGKMLQIFWSARDLHGNMTAASGWDGVADPAYGNAEKRPRRAAFVSAKADQ